MLLYAMSRGEMQGGHELRPRIRHKPPKRMLRSWYSFLNQENNKLKLTCTVEETGKQPVYKTITSSQVPKEKELETCEETSPAVDCNGFFPLKYSNHVSHVEKAVISKTDIVDHVSDSQQGGWNSPTISVKDDDDDDDETEEEEEEEEEDEDSDLMCTVCSKGESEPPNEIVICDTCNKGFHQLCHLPKICDQVLLPNIPWHCRHCVPVGSVRKSAKNYRNGTRVQTFKLGLPYDIKALEWDRYHRTNLRSCYCYCGGPGEWNKKMLQCQVCQQWFHEACIQSLETPLLYGDRFYNFTCSVCNNGPEIVKRLPLTWLDVTHLMLYNINVENPRKNYDLDEDLLPYLNSIWLALQLPPDMSRASPRERRCSIFRSLDRDELRFKATKDMKKRRLLWCLRIKTVPPLPHEVEQPEKDCVGRTDEDGFMRNALNKRTVPQRSHSPSPDKEESRRRKNSNHAKNNSTGRKPSNGLVRHINSKTPVKAFTKAHFNGACRVPPNGTIGAGSAVTFLETFIPPLPDFGGSNHPFHNLDEGRPKAKRCRTRRPAKPNLSSQKDIRTAYKRRRRRSTSVSTSNTAGTEESSCSDTSDGEVDVTCTTALRWHRRSRGNREVSGPNGTMKVLARRMTPDGKIQFLVERDG